MKFKNWNMKLLFGINFFMIFIANYATAGEIISEDYRYPPENNVSYLENNTFLICESCPEPDSLVLKPKFPLTIRESGFKKAIPSETLAHLNSPIQETTISNNAKETPDLKKPNNPQIFTIHFAFNSDKITPYSQKKLEEILKNLGTSKGSKTITLLGYTCDIGTDIYNSNLSTQRALAVERYFQSKGFQHTRVSGKGSCCPISDQQSLNRRVEIIVQPGEK